MHASLTAFFAALGDASGLSPEELPAAFRAEAGRSVRSTRLEAGQVLAREADDCAYLPIVAAGALRIFKVSENGREITLYRVERGESCVLTASCMLSRRAFPAQAIAESHTEILLVPADRFQKWMSEFEFFRAYVYSVTSRRLDSIIAMVTEVAFARIDLRIADYLLQRCSPEQDHLRATHQEIANDLGTAREVVSRILKEMEREGMIVLGRGDVRILDRKKIEKKSALRD